MARADYAPTQAPSGAGGVIAAVVPGSPAARVGLIPGQRIVSADGVALHDILDWQWLSDGDRLQLTLADDSGNTTEAVIERQASEPWGLEFTSTLFDAVRTCSNRCAFCFMSQLPRGMRRSLYLRDDDYRLSFIQGNFVTLTNLTDEDVDRIVEQHLSPLYVSVHAVDPDVRARLICARDDRALERFDTLLQQGIDAHVQIVLVPGVNDGAVLDESLTWLAEREGVLSVGIVPLGYTRHQSEYQTSFNDPIAAATVIQQVQRWQFAMKERDDIAWVQLADEFYLNARAPIPTAEWYDGFVQYENGIGLVRSFVDEATALLPQLKSATAALPASDQVTVLTSVMAATTIVGALNAMEAAGRVRLLVVPNTFFGGNVAVTGLLTGADIVHAIVRDAGDGVYLLPDVVMNHDGLTLDDLTIDDIRSRTQAHVRLVSSDAAGLLAGIDAAAITLATNPKE